MKIETFHLRMKHNIIQMTATAGFTVSALLVEINEPVMRSLPSACFSILTLIEKSGFYGRSGHSAYQQRSLEDINDQNYIII